MATVHLGRLFGPVGFSRTVAIKRLHAELAADPEFVSMFVDEAKLAARIRHPNVVATLDVVTTNGELFLVMEHILGASLSQLIRATRAREEWIPVPIVSAVLSGVLLGLHAAHEAKDERGEPLAIVHRDVSPQNVIVGSDGLARVLDFGIAKAASRRSTTRGGRLKGKLPYMSPEQLARGEVTRRTDVYAAAVVLWEALTGKGLFHDDSEAAILRRVLHDSVPAPSAVGRGDEIAMLDAVVLRGLSRDATERFDTAREMALAIEKAATPASPAEISAWVERVAGEVLAQRAAQVVGVETGPRERADSMASAEITAGDVAAPESGDAADDAAAHASVGMAEAAPIERPAWSKRIAAIALVALGVPVAVVLLARACVARPSSAVSAPARLAEGLLEGDASVALGPEPPTTPPVVVTGAGASSSGTRSAPKRAPAPPHGASARCKQPFAWGPDGVKYYKPACL